MSELPGFNGWHITNTLVDDSGVVNGPHIIPELYVSTAYFSSLLVSSCLIDCFTRLLS